MTTGGRTSPTLDEVAVLAGVSRATVSRVVNDSPRVSPEARRAVQEAVAQLRYVPNRMARSLVTRRTDTIAMVLSESNMHFFSDPVLSTLAHELSARFGDTDRALVMLSARNRREQERVGRWVRQGHVDGVVLVSLHSQDLLPRALQESGVPHVLLGRPLDGSEAAYVDVDSVAGGRTATEHLVGLGRQRIATVTGPLDQVAGIDRYAGYQQALAAAGLPHCPERVAEGDFTEGGGARAMTTLLERAPDLDAVFVASDLMALGALRVLRGAGRQVPADVAVVGFDDSAVAPSAEPPLTTVAQPIDEIGRRMAELLLRQIEGQAEGVETCLCDTRLVVRASA
ncbi:LacI family DNA-binding transcriptional regulator [Blastococcus sp. SYSU D00820]